MKTVGMALLAGIFGAFTSASTVAVPLDITFTGGAPSQNWGSGLYGDYGFVDPIPVANRAQVSSINLAGVNSISMTWSAPAGCMYVVDPPPAGVLFPNLEFEAEYGSSGQASSLGSVTASSLSVQTVYGTSPLKAEAFLNPSAGPSLDFIAEGAMNSSAAPFAFTSITISADFSGTGTSQTLDKTDYDEQSSFFGALFGYFSVGPNGPIVPADPGPLLTIEPLESESVPDDSSTLGLAGLGFAGLLLFRPKRDTLKR